jgi:tRNA(Ile)-lysidine synthase TilS/MesJ
VIRDLLKKNFVSFREDSSNTDEVYSRNYIRSKIIPAVSDRFGQEAFGRILSSGKLFSSIDRFIEKSADLMITHLPYRIFA